MPIHVGIYIEKLSGLRFKTPSYIQHLTFITDSLDSIIFFTATMYLMLLYPTTSHLLHLSSFSSSSQSLCTWSGLEGMASSYINENNFQTHKYVYQIQIYGDFLFIAIPEVFISHWACTKNTDRIVTCHTLLHMVDSIAGAVPVYRR